MATAIVALGLLWEYGAELTEKLIDRLEENRPIGSLKRKSPRWLSYFMVLGAIAVTVGVAGELLIESAAYRDESRLRAMTDSTQLQMRNDITNAELETEYERRARVEAQSAFLSHFNRLVKQVGWRVNVFDTAKFKSLLLGKPKGVADIRFVSDDDEAQALAASGITQNRPMRIT